VEQVFEFLSRTADGAYAVNRQQRIVFWNSSARQVLGYEPQEVLGRHCFKVLQGKDENSCVVCRKNCLAIEMAAREAPIPTRDMSARRKSGDRVWLGVSTLVLPSRWHELYVLAHLFRDVGRLKELERNHKQLLRTVALAASGIPAETSERLPELGAPEKLSGREREVLWLLAYGASTRTIADRLFISTATVRNHVSRIFAKLGVHSRLEAVTLLLRDGPLDELRETRSKTAVDSGDPVSS